MKKTLKGNRLKMQTQMTTRIMRQNNMRKLLTTTVMMCLVVLAYGQKYKVESVKMYYVGGDAATQTLEQKQASIADNLSLIKEAEKHPKTANDPKMWYYRGIVYLSLNNEGSDEQKAANPDALNTATQSFYNCMEADVKNRHTKDAKLQLVNCAIGHYNVAVSSFNAKDYAKALAAYQQVSKIFPYDEEEFLTKQAQIDPATIKLYSAYSAIGAGDVTMAKKYLQELIDEAYGDPRIYGDMADILLTEKDTTGALDILAQGREMYERDANLMRTELDIMMKLGRSEELTEKLDKAVEAEPNSAVLHFARAINYYNLDNDKEAEKGYLRVVEIDPTYADAFFNLGVIYLDRCKPIAKKIEKVSYEASLPMEEEIDALYAKAVAQFAKAMEVGEYSDAQKLDLAKNMKKLYGRLRQNDPTGEYKKKYDQMKTFIAELGGDD